MCRRMASAPHRPRSRWTAQILNSPVERQDLLHADVGFYAQDAWTLNRLTLNYGARIEH